MKTTKLFALGLFLSSTLLNLAQDPDTTSFTLTEAKIYAQEHHANIKNALLDVDIAKKQIVETRGIGLPQVDINGTFNNFINLPVQVVDASFINPMAQPGETISFKAGTEYSASGTLQASQLIFNGSYIVGLKASSYYAQFQETAAQLTEEDVLFNVIQAYELASVAQQNMVFADSIVAITQRLVDKQRNFLELGFMLQEDFDQLQYSLISAKNAFTNAEVQYKNSIALLKLSMGYPMGNDLTLEDNLETLVQMSHVSSSGSDVFQNLNYQVLEKKVHLSELDIQNNKMANLPTLSAFFNQTYNAYRNEFNFFNDDQWYPQTVWGLQLNIPIFSGGQRYARTAQAKIKLMQDMNSLSLLEESLKFQEVQYRNNLIGAQNKYEMQQDNVRLARSIYDNAVLKEKIGKGNSIIVTQKQQQLMLAQSQYIGSLIELFQAKLDMDKLYNNIITTK